MARRFGPLVFVAAAIAAVVLARRARDHIAGRDAPGGILIADPSAYDAHSRRLFRSFFAGIASDIASTASTSAKVLEVGCGPGICRSAWPATMGSTSPASTSIRT